MGPRAVVLTFVSAVAAVIAGFIGGGLVRELVGSEHEVAVGVVDAEAGVPIATSSPTPSPTSSAAPVESPEPTDEITPLPSEAESPTPDASVGPCPGAPPREGCECRERKRNSRWVCPLT